MFSLRLTVCQLRAYFWLFSTARLSAAMFHLEKEVVFVKRPLLLEKPEFIVYKLTFFINMFAAKLKGYKHSPWSILWTQIRTAKSFVSHPMFFLNIQKPKVSKLIACDFSSSINALQQRFQTWPTHIQQKFSNSNFRYIQSTRFLSTIVTIILLLLSTFICHKYNCYKI